MSELIRTFIVRTNPYWPFSSLNRAPYRLALKAFVRLCRKFPQIRSIYLRHGLLHSDWLPAVSDIDLTILFQPDSETKEFQFLQSFWNEFDNLKRLFPMIGEVDLLDVEQIAAWTRYTICGFEAKSWKLLSGDDLLEISYCEPPEQIRIDAMNYALLYYFNFLLRRLTVPQNTSVAFAQLQRIASKILRYASYANGHPSLATHERSGFSLFENLLHSLNPLLASFINQTNGPTDAVFNFELREALQYPSEQMETLVRFDKAVRAVYRLTPRNVVVLSDDSAGHSLEIMKLCADGDAPMLVDFQLFHCLLRFFNPLLYTRLAAYRKLVYGEDLLPGIPAPGMHSFQRHILDHTPTVLSFPTSRSFIHCRQPEWFAGQAVESVLHRALFLRLLHDHGIVLPEYSCLIEETKKRYPSIFAEYQKALQESRSEVGPGLYRLFRSLNKEICKVSR